MRLGLPRPLAALQTHFGSRYPCPSGVTGVFQVRFNDGAVECLMLARLQRAGDRSGKRRLTSRTDVSRPRHAIPDRPGCSDATVPVAA